MTTRVDHLRQNYTDGELTEESALANPFAQFDQWLQAAIAAEMMEPNAMTLATASTDGQPHARMVLLKDFDENGFVFYTNYASHKGQQLAENSRAALVFWWDKLQRQVRIEGHVVSVEPEESDQYFHTRPRKSQLGAAASDQSQVIDSRELLEQRLAELETRYADTTIPRPKSWGGYRVIPHTIEFWQGRRSRLHDRLQYTKVNHHWQIARLSP